MISTRVQEPALARKYYGDAKESFDLVLTFPPIDFLCDAAWSASPLYHFYRSLEKFKRVFSRSPAEWALLRCYEVEKIRYARMVSVVIQLTNSFKIEFIP